MADEPSVTRWSFQFGRKKEPKEKDSAASGQNAGSAIANGSTAYATSNGSGHVKNTSDMAIFEQYASQDRGSSTHSNGVLSNGAREKPQKSLLPPFESAEMRTLADSLSRDIIRGGPDVKWESIKGLENAKHLLKEAVVMPIKYPNLNVDYIREILFFFGLKINIGKNELLPAGKVGEIADLANILGCGIGSFPVTYLDLPLGLHRGGCVYLDPVVDRLRGDLQVGRSNIF